MIGGRELDTTTRRYKRLSGSVGDLTVGKKSNRMPDSPKSASAITSGSHESEDRWLRGLALLYVAATPFDLVYIPLLGRTPAKFIGGILCFFWLFQIVFNNRRPALRRGNALAILLFALWVSLTAFWSANAPATISSAIGMVGLVTSAFAIADLLFESVIAPARALLIGCLLLALPIFTPIARVRSGRVSYWGQDENTLAYRLCLGVGAACYLLLRDPERRRRLFALAGLILLTVATLMTGSRTSLGVLAATLTLAVVIGARRFSTLVTSLASCVIAWQAFQFLLQNGKLPPRMVMWLDDPAISDNRAAIIDVYRYTQDYWNLKGVGLSADRDYLMATGLGSHNAHSGFWAMWIETGLIGLILGGAVLVSTVIAGLTAPNKIFILLCVPTFVAFGYTLGGFLDNAIWVLIGLAIGRRRVPSSAPKGPAGSARMRV